MALLVLLILVVSLLPSTASTAAASEAQSYSGQGVAGSTLYGIHEANSWRRPVGAPTPTQVGDLLEGAGAEHHRWTIPWNHVESDPPLNGTHQYDFSRSDPMYKADLARGIRPLIVVINAPSWALPAGMPYGIGRGIPPSPEHLGDWADFCAEVARRYPEAIGIEVWNEPNHIAFWGRGTEITPDPDFYLQLLSRAHTAIKDVDPSMPVVGGALSNGQRTLSNGQISGQEFATAMFEKGAAQHMDGVSIHAAPIAQGAPDHTLFEPTIEQLRQARAAVGAKTPIWLTEVGVTTNPGTLMTVTKDQQASILRDFFWWVQTQEDIEAFFVHTLTEPVPGNGYALIDGDATTGFTPKPAYEALARAAAGSGTGPSFGPAAAASNSPNVGAGTVEPLHVWITRTRTRGVRQQRSVAVSIRCTQSCVAVSRATASISYRGRRLRSKLSPRSTVLRAGMRGRIVMRLRRGARRMLRRGGRANIRVKVWVRAETGARASDGVAFRLRH